MKPVYRMRVPTLGLSFKPKEVKHTRKSSVKKSVHKILYCIAKETENGWRAYINTKGIEGYKNITILPFTDSSFDVHGVTNVFYKDKKTKQTVMFVRSEHEAIVYPGDRLLYCTLCNGCVYSGYIVNINGELQFDMSIYQGTKRECSNLITNINSEEDDTC